MNDEVKTGETKMELLKLINRTGIRVVLPNDIENQLHDLEELIRQLRQELDANRSGFDRVPQGDSVRLAVLKKIAAVNTFRIFQ